MEVCMAVLRLLENRGSLKLYWGGIVAKLILWIFTLERSSKVEVLAGILSSKLLLSGPKGTFS